jgi:hypothetical protein
VSNDEQTIQPVPVEVAELFDMRCFSVFQAGIRRYPVETALTILKMEFQQHHPGVPLSCFKDKNLWQVLVTQFAEKHPEISADCFTKGGNLVSY